VFTLVYKAKERWDLMDIVQAFQTLCQRDRQQWNEAIEVLWKQMVGAWRVSKYDAFWDDYCNEICGELLQRGLSANAIPKGQSIPQIRGYFVKAIVRKYIRKEKHQERHVEIEGISERAASTPVNTGAVEGIPYELRQTLEHFHKHCLPALKGLQRVDAQRRWMEDWGRLEALATQRKTMDELAREYHQAGHSDTPGQARTALQQRNSRFRRRALKGIKRLRAQKRISADDAKLFEAFIERYCRQRRKTKPAK
jgi:hypothetical protein